MCLTGQGWRGCTLSQTLSVRVGAGALGGAWVRRGSSLVWLTGAVWSGYLSGSQVLPGGWCRNGQGEVSFMMSPHKASYQVAMVGLAL